MSPPQGVSDNVTGTTATTATTTSPIMTTSTNDSNSNPPMNPSKDNDIIDTSTGISKLDKESQIVEIITPKTTQTQTTTEPPPFQHPQWYAKRKVHEKSLEDQANCISEWFLQYLSPLLKLGSMKVLDQNDIGVPSEQDRASRAFHLMGQAWQIQCEKAAKINKNRKEKYDAKYAKMTPKQKTKCKPFLEQDPSIAHALANSFGVCAIIMSIAYYILSALLQFIPVMILEDLVKYFETVNTNTPHQTIFHPWVEVVALGLTPFLTSLLQTRSQCIFQHASVFVRTAISTLLYEKSLSVSAAGRAATSTGQVVNMMSNDTTQLQRFIQFAGMTLVAPLQIIIALVLIYRQVGAATWVGVGFMITLAPVNIVVFSVVGKMRRKVLKYSDLRVKMTNEILAGIRIIKFYAWEKPFKREISSIRDKELKALTNLAYVAAVGFSLILLSAPIIQPILVFLTYINIQDQPLTASTAFTTVSLFNIMRFPFAFLPMGLLQYIQSKIALRRLEKYLQLPELTNYIESKPHPDNDSDEKTAGSEKYSVTMKNASFSWTNRSANIKPIDMSEAKKKKKKERRGSGSSQGSAKSMRSSMKSEKNSNEINEEPLTDIETLRNLNVTIKAGELVAVVGPVGCGKSSFLSAILGEMEPLNNSKIYIPHDESEKEHFVSYCSQSPWVVNDNLRGNVLFGREFDKDRYEKVIEACALLDDLAILPAGDMTEIGERGINLSGGQKARVSLARALYSTGTKLVLLDDPLSAVDAHVGEHLFDKAIVGDVCPEATRILVTHHVHFLPRCDKVIVLEGGEIKHFGKYTDLVKQGVDFAGAVDFDEKDDDEKNKDGNEIADEIAVDEPQPKKSSEVDSEESLKQKSEMKKKGENLTSKEEREEGAVEGAAYVKYARAGGFFMFFGAFVTQGIGRASEVLSAFWLAHWAKQSIFAQIEISKGVPESNFPNTSYYLNIYAAFGMLGVLCLTVRALIIAIHRLHASRRLHDGLISSILRAPVSFFDGKFFTFTFFSLETFTHGFFIFILCCTQLHQLDAF